MVAQSLSLGSVYPTVAFAAEELAQLTPENAAAAMATRLKSFDAFAFPASRFRCQGSSTNSQICRGHIATIPSSLPAYSAGANATLLGLRNLITRLIADKWDLVDINGNRWG